MKSKILILGLIAAFTFFALPTNSLEANGQRGWRNRDRGYYTYGGHRRYRGKKRHWGYKNYGQYRRQQVGWRRYRWERRYYWRDGYRYSRLIRVFF